MSDRPLISKAGFAWLFKMAWRDGKASGKRLLLFMASIILGIAAVVSIQSFSQNLKDNIASQSKELMGVDLSFTEGTLPSHSDFALYQNSPNPFRNQTKIGFVLPIASTRP